MQLNDNNFDINHIYLQRRQLNIQDEEHVAYASDEEEAKYLLPIPDDEEPEEAKDSLVQAPARSENHHGPPMAAPGAGLLVPINNNRRANGREERKGGLFDNPG